MPDVDRARRHPRRISALLLAVLVLTTACGSPTPTPSAATAAPTTASPSAAASPSAGPSATPASSPDASPTGAPSPTPSATPVATLSKGMLAVTVTDGVRVRSQPRVANDSRLYKPVLPAGTSLLVAGGPVVANGYTWIEVSVLSATLDGGVDTGWVAVADHNGTPWVALDPSASTGLQLASSSTAQASGSLAAARQEASQANAFGVALYRKLLASGQAAVAKGMVFSPTSIVDALAMARAGAAGSTATQMDAVLRANSWGQLSLGIASLDRQLAARDGSYVDENGDVRALRLHLANTAFVQQGFPVTPDYLARLGKTFGAGVALVDFAADTQGAIDAINGWVKAQTVGKIPVIVNKSSITSETRLALVNAVYLKANWAQQFDPDLTASGAFSRFDGSKASVPMMREFGGQAIGLATGSGWKATELFYRGPAGAPLEMTLILPDNLRTFEQTMTTGTLSAVQTKLAAAERGLQKVTYAGQESCGTYPYQVELRLPRFGIDTGLGLASTLGSMGMPLAITPGAADFSGIAPNRGLYISEVIHKATIDVDEKGTTAAAATVVVVGTGGCLGPEPAKTVRLTFNHPFLFVIRDVKTGAILFIGRVTDPTQR